MSAQYVVCPHRFSADPSAMIAFLEVLGLRLAISTADRSFGILAGRGGRVAVHSAGLSASAVPAGRSSLSLEVSDATSAYDALMAAGLDPVVWDEAYGTQVGLRDPFDHGVWVNGQMRDLYGYVAHEESAPSPVEVAAVYYNRDFDAAASFFGSFGFTGTDGLEGWRPLRGGNGSGVLGLHDGPPQRAHTAPTTPCRPVHWSTSRSGRPSHWLTSPLGFARPAMRCGSTTTAPPRTTRSPTPTAASWSCTRPPDALEERIRFAEMTAMSVNPARMRGYRY